ncbi:hydantoinase B/oxoprolinase family protein [Methylobacterium dankookense]|uniref:Acetophenone carboxylase delta subunit n=1 Tax=Methylobacterium dankookense TaxID=560405 RepID=A0A564G193_9HYPH|nr:hydantoinase B/oxoprolinase family protein [Methylobacterium dankookense]GJD54766.1 Acetophenone carboxylase delta subunit [Methylobacterium dankookense]VUF14239.1 Acetophenone carboxylase delta subunit [Methylobacterium dankookense]
MTDTQRTLGPIELEVIHGTIRAAELEIEAAVERTARSPMIRDQHDYRVALFDAKGRKLTGRSYSAIVEPVFQYFGADDIHPGDVFFWNDPYNSCGGIGHVPDLCTTVPIFLGERLIGFSQVFGHHDDIGGAVPGSLPVHATDSWMEGTMIPPIKLYERGKLNAAAFRIIVRNSRLSEHLAGDLDAEIGAARLGSRRIVALAERYGIDTLEAAFDQILRNTAEVFRREILPKIADGAYTFEDYIEHDGVDEDRLHALRVTMIKTPDRIVLDFTGTDPEAKGPINWALDEAEGRYFRKWLAPTLRSLADSPERAAEIDSNEGVLDVIDVVFPEKGTLITPTFGKPTGMRFFLMLRTLGAFAACLSKATGGRMPADHETIRIWGVTGGRRQEDFYLFREVLGGGSPGRPWADGSDVVHIVPNSKNLPAEFSETRYPILVEELGLKQGSGGPGYHRGGFGYDKRIRVLDECRLISNADRSLLGCYGVNGGKAGENYQVSVIDAEGEETVHPGMSDTVTVPAGATIRVVTTGGGGWGDPLARPVARVVADVQCGLVTESSARHDYGVVLRCEGRIWQADLAATEAQRAGLAKARGIPAMFDRGPYFAALKAAGKVARPEGFPDPDAGWFARPVA